MGTVVSDEPLVTVQVRLSRETIARVDRYRLGLSMLPSRSMVLRFLIENAINIVEEQQRGLQQAKDSRRP